MKTKPQKMKDLQTVRRHKLIIQKKTSFDENDMPITDEWGNPIEDWTDWKTVAAQRMELYGSDYYAAKQYGEEKTIKWKMKHVSFLEEINTEKYRVIDVRTNEIWDIKDTDSLNDDGQWFVIKAEKSGELDGSDG